MVSTFPHDPKAFTQGLIYRDGLLYESTGLTGSRAFARSHSKPAVVLQGVRGPGDFAEGLTEWGTTSCS